MWLLSCLRFLGKSPRVPFHLVCCLPTLHTVLCLDAQSRPTLCDPMDYSPPESSVPGESPGKNTGVGCHALLQGIFPAQVSNPGLLPCRQILHPLSQSGRLKNTGVGILSLLQGIFPTQESNRGVLHCRRILYQLSYQGDPYTQGHCCGFVGVEAIPPSS